MNVHFSQYEYEVDVEGEVEGMLVRFSFCISKDQDRIGNVTHPWALGCKNPLLWQMRLG